MSAARSHRPPDKVAVGGFDTIRQPASTGFFLGRGVVGARGVDACRPLGAGDEQAHLDGADAAPDVEHGLAVDAAPIDLDQVAGGAVRASAPIVAQLSAGYLAELMFDSVTLRADGISIQLSAIRSRLGQWALIRDSAD